MRAPKQTQTSRLGVQCAPDSIHHVAAKVVERFEQAQRHPNRWYRWRTIGFRNFKNNRKCSINKENPCVQSSMGERVTLAQIRRWNWKDEMQHLFLQSPEVEQQVTRQKRLCLRIKQLPKINTIGTRSVVWWPCPCWNHWEETRGNGSCKKYSREADFKLFIKSESRRTDWPRGHHSESTPAFHCSQTQNKAELIWGQCLRGYRVCVYVCARVRVCVCVMSSQVKILFQGQVEHWNYILVVCVCDLMSSQVNFYFKDRWNIEIIS